VDIKKWNPITFAVNNGNLKLVKYLMEQCIGNYKKLTKIPGISNTSEVNRLYPFMISLNSNKMEMFKFFWEDLGGFLWNEDVFDTLFKLLAKKELVDYLPFLFRSSTTHTIFTAMSYQYRFSFIEHLL
jgi:hypothetical protein